MLHCRCLMLKFTKILILVCRKNFSAFYPLLQETFSNSCGFHLIWELNLFLTYILLYDRTHFCSILTNLSNLSHSRWLFLFHQKFPLLSSDLKMFLQNTFQNCSQNRCYYKFLDIHKKISVLESFLNKVTGLMASNFIKNRPQHRCFPVNVAECLRKAFLYGTTLVAGSENRRISKNF